MSDERKINLGGGYWLCSDQFCCWISKEYVTKDGKNKGKKYLRRYSGYVSNVEDALESVVDRYTREVNAKSINTLIKEIKTLKTEIRALIGEYNERI